MGSKIALADKNFKYIGNPNLYLDEQGTLAYINSFDNGADYDTFINAQHEGDRPNKEILDSLLSKNLIKII